MKLPFTSRLPQPQGFICDAWGNVPAPHIRTPEEVQADLDALPDDLALSIVEARVAKMDARVSDPWITRMDREKWTRMKPGDLG